MTYRCPKCARVRTSNGARSMSLKCQDRTWPPLQEVAELPLVMTADPPHHCLAGNLARSHEPIVASSCRNSLGRCNKEIGCSEIQFVCANLGPTDETQRPAFSDLSGPVPG